MMLSPHISPIRLLLSGSRLPSMSYGGPLTTLPVPAAPNAPSLVFFPGLLACLLPALCGGCSWFQTLQDGFKTTPAPVPAQAIPMPVTDVPVRMLYPRGTKTVDEAVSYMLEPHNYRAARWNPAGERMARRRFIDNFNAEPVPIRIALQRLLGPDGQIILDSHGKLYRYRLKATGEPGVVLADLAVATAGPRVGAAPRRALVPGRAHLGVATAGPKAGAAPGVQAQEPPDSPATGSERHKDAGNRTTRRVVDPDPAEGEATAAEPGARCRFIQFTNRAMLSATVREYFRSCGFEEVFWRLGAPGRYADYRLTQNLKVPLPNAHEDLIKLLRARFGIRTLIHDNNQVEFHDEDKTR